MAGTRIETEFAALGADGVVRAFEAHDAALVRSTEAARKQSTVQSRQATLLRQLREAEREEQQQLKQAAGIIDRTATAEERYDKEIRERQAHLKAGRLTQEQYNRAVGDSKTRLAGATSSTTSLAGSIFRTAAAVTGVTGAVGALLAMSRLLTREFDNIVTRQKRAAETSITDEQALAGAVRNTSGVLTATETETLARDLASRANVSVSKAAQVAGQAVTSSGGKNREEALGAIDAADASLEFDPNRPAEELAIEAGIASSFQKQLGVDPRSTIGFTNRAQQQSNVADVGKFTANFGPVVTGLIAQGFKEDEAAALYSTITQLAGDSEGNTSRTAIAGFAATLRARFRELPAFETDGDFDPIKAMTYLQQNKDARDAVLLGTKESKGKLLFGEKVPKAKLGKSGFGPFFEKLLTGGSQASRDFAERVDAIGTFEDGRATFDEVTAGVRRVTLNTQRKEILKNAASRVESGSSEAAAGAVREPLGRLSQALGKTSVAQTLERIQLESASGLGTDQGAVDQFILDKLIKERQARLATTTTDYRSAGTGAAPVAIRVPRSPSDEDRQIARELQPAIEALQRIVELQEDILAAGQMDPAAAQPRVPESVSNTESPRVSALSAEASR